MDKMQELISRLMQDMQPAGTAPVAPAGQPGEATVADYPILEKHPEWVVTPTGKSVSRVTMEAVREGSVAGEDLRISRDMLLRQAQIAKSAGKPQVYENLCRAAELIDVPDDLVIKMYDGLRPNRSTRAQLMEMADTLRTQYHADRCAKLVTEAMEIYDKRGILLK